MRAVLEARGCVRVLLRNPFDHAAIKRLTEGQQKGSPGDEASSCLCAPQFAKNGSTRVSARHGYRAQTSQ